MLQRKKKPVRKGPDRFFSQVGQAPLIANPTLPPELENDAAASRCPNLLQKPELPARGQNNIQLTTMQ
ncbi:protein of unknown function [Hyphomicrobium sp. 1Nfss2.1]